MSALNEVLDDLGQPETTAKPEPDDLRLWSVTTIIGVLDKPALLYWAAEETAKAAIFSWNTWRSMLTDQGEDEAIKWLRDARFRRPKGELSATALGTVVHKACESYALTGKRPTLAEITVLVKAEGGRNMGEAPAMRCAKEVEPFIDRFDEWLQEFQPQYQATEVAVYHPEYGYAGTADAFLTVDGFRAIVDYKSSRSSVDSRGKVRGPYPESALQLAGYRHAKYAAVWRPRVHEHFRRRYYLLGPSEQAMGQPVPEVDGGLVIHITPEHCNAHPVRCDERVFEAFLYCIETARWQFELADQVVGLPLVKLNGGGT